MTNGLLIQPFTTVIWAGTNLSAYEGPGGLECLANNVNVNLNKGESAPTCSFEIAPTPVGFQVFQELKGSALNEPWVITFGYPGSSTTVSWSFKFVGMSLTTGHEPNLKINGVSSIKGCWTDNKISYTMEKEIALAEFPKFLQEKAGECAGELKFKFAGQAKEKVAKIMHKGNQVQRTPHSILVDVMRSSGVDVQVNDTALDGTVVLSYAPTVKGEPQADPAEPADAGAKPGIRTFHIIGVGIMGNVTRDQKFNTGSTLGKRNAANTSTVSPQVAAKGVAQPKSSPQEGAATQETTSATRGRANPGSNETALTKPDPKAKEIEAALASVMTTTINFKIPMLPRNIAMRPRDIVVIPSLSGPGSYLEDWEVTDVQYQSGKENGDIEISITGNRPFTGENTLITGTPVESQIKGIVSGLTSPAAWQAYYWVQGVQPELPLLS